MLVKEIVYSILDLAKAATSDDSFLTEDHVIFLIKKYRNFLIKKEQDKNKGTDNIASDSEYQEICLDLERVMAIDGLPCAGGYYLKTKTKIPKILEGNTPNIFPLNYYQGNNISYVPKEKMKYIGTNPFLQNIIYVSLAPDQYLYLKSSNPQFIYLKKLKVSAVFDDFEEAANARCDSSDDTKLCDILESEFPMRGYLVPTLIELVVNALVGTNYKPVDNKNNASDDLTKLSNNQD